MFPVGLHPDSNVFTTKLSVIAVGELSRCTLDVELTSRTISADGDTSIAASKQLDRRSGRVVADASILTTRMDGSTRRTIVSTMVRVTWPRRIRLRLRHLLRGVSQRLFRR